MAGNFLSRALLSIFIDKSAREKLDAIQEVKRRGKASTVPAPDAPKAPPAAAPDDDDILPETLVRRAIDEAAAELERKKNLPPGRRALIEEALAIQDSKRKILDDLPVEQREKLMFMAMHAFGQEAGARAAKSPAAPKKKKP